MTKSPSSTIWRITVSGWLCAAAGGAVAVAFPIHHFWLMNLWLGLAGGALPGFALGVMWQLKSATPARDWIGKACFRGLLVIAMAGMAFGVVLSQMRSEIANLTSLSQLQAESLHMIEVFDQYGNKHIANITDSNSLAAFTRGMADAVGHSPNHPRYTESWYVVIDGTTKHEFELHFDPRFPQSVIGYFVTKSGNTTSYHGAFESKGLRPWIEKHLMK